MARIKISKNNYFHNLNLLAQITSKEKLAVVLKDNAYGHGLKLMGKLAKEFGVEKAIVRTVEEAEVIKDLFPFILILSDKLTKSLPENMSITVNTLEDISNYPKGSNIHIKVDTGMHRNGIERGQLQKALLRSLQSGHKIKGVFSHSRSGDELTSECFWQLKNFEGIKEEVLDFCQENSLETPMFHFSNSATITRFKESALFDMARVGIASYGYDENADTLDTLDLKPVMSLWGDKISERNISKGERIGYGGGYESERDFIAGTYDIGYGDGFFRLRSNDRYYTPDGFRVLGRVSMDSLTLDCNEESVKIFGSVRDLSMIFDTISYDILVKLKDNIKREIDG